MLKYQMIDIQVLFLFQTWLYFPQYFNFYLLGT